MTLQLVRVCKSFHRKAMTQNTALAAIIHEDAQWRAALTAQKIEDMLALADEGASKIVDNEFSELEEALLNDTDFLPALERYLNKNL